MQARRTEPDPKCTAATTQSDRARAFRHSGGRFPALGARLMATGLAGLPWIHAQINAHGAPHSGPLKPQATDRSLAQ